MTSATNGPGREPQWKCGNEFAPYHPAASHVDPDYRDGWNACYAMARAAPPAAPRRERRWEDLEPVERWAARYAGIYPPGYQREPAAVDKTPNPQGCPVDKSAESHGQPAPEPAADAKHDGCGLGLEWSHCKACADLIEQQARELADTRAALGAIDVRGPDGDGLVWIECAMPGVASGAVSLIGHSLAARVFVFWRDELLKPAQSVSTRETK